MVRVEPDFVIVGYRQDDLCFALGSTQLTHFELVQKTEMRESVEQISSIRTMIPGKTRILLSGEMRGYTLAWGSTYEEALRTLLSSSEFKLDQEYSLGRADSRALPPAESP